MKGIFLDKSINLITKYYDYDDIKLKEIKYGLETLYITITKTVVIFLLAYFLDLIKELLLLLLFYSILRLTAHGLHAKKSWHCWISSIFSFLLMPYLIKVTEFNLISKIILSITTFILIAIYSPADTEKKPIINKKKRIVLKVISIISSLIYIALIFILDDPLFINSLLFSLITQTILILPISYKIFDLKYANYKTYLKTQKA